MLGAIIRERLLLLYVYIYSGHYLQQKGQVKGHNFKMIYVNVHLKVKFCMKLKVMVKAILNIKAMVKVKV